MNKKQFGVTTTLVCLMLVMVIGEKFFTGKIKDVALINNNIESMLSYSALDGQVIYELPDNWNCKEVYYPGDYIVYNNNFYGEEMGINGYAQIINTQSTLDEVVNSDVKILKEEKEKIKDMKSLSERIGEKTAKKLIYDEKTSNGRIYETKVYYAVLEQGKSILKLSFSSGKDKYKENYETIYKIILESFKRKI